MTRNAEIRTRIVKSFTKLFPIYGVKNYLMEKKIEFEIVRQSSGRLLLKNNLYKNLSCDRMCPHFDGKFANRFEGWLSDLDREELKYKVRTIGGHIVFPAHRRSGFTVDQSRGVNRKIGDRFDLTLECIRRYYLGQESPLFKTLQVYSDFFELFVDFNGYIDFFFLQDFIKTDGHVNFSMPFDDFKRDPLPQTIHEYKHYKEHTVDLMNKRNMRILQMVS